MLRESDIIPFHLSPPAGERVLVLAPHPDDETLGCGGAIRLLVEAKKHVKVVFLTSGDRGDPEHQFSGIVINEKYLSQRDAKKSPSIPLFQRGNKSVTPFWKRASLFCPPLWKRGVRGDFMINSTIISGSMTKTGRYTEKAHITAYSLMREKEAQKALRTLGVSDYEFLRFPDRGVQAEYNAVLASLLKVVEEFMPDTLYSPSMVELNPDHRAAAEIALEIQRSACGDNRSYIMTDTTYTRPPMRLVFYEVTTPLRPNILVDVTSAYRKKERAVKRYRSQLRLMDYLRHITALNTVRTLTVKGPKYVEAFWLVDGPLSEEDIADWLSYRQAISY